MSEGLPTLKSLQDENLGPLRDELCDCQSDFRASAQPEDHQVACAFRVRVRELEGEQYEMRLEEGWVLIG